MAEHGHARIKANFLLDAGGNLHRAACALGHHDHEMREAVETRRADLFNDLFLEIPALRDENRRRADRKSDKQRQMTGVAAHDLHDRAALVRLHRVAQLIDALDGGVGRRVKADAVMRAGNIIVDRRGQADHGDAVFGERQRAAERSVAADGDDTVQSKQLAGVHGLLLSLGRHEFLAARGVEDRAAAVDDVRDALFVQTHDVAVDESVPAAPDADHLDAEMKRRAHDAADRRIHAGRVAAAGQNADPADGFLCFCHEAHLTFCRLPPAKFSIVFYPF